jgi:hypothetical protein
MFETPQNFKPTNQSNDQSNQNTKRPARRAQARLTAGVRRARGDAGARAQRCVLRFAFCACARARARVDISQAGGEGRRDSLALPKTLHRNPKKTRPNPKHNQTKNQTNQNQNQKTKGLSPRSSRRASAAALARYGGPDCFALPGK